jgi:hypothetical protein
MELEEEEKKYAAQGCLTNREKHSKGRMGEKETIYLNRWFFFLVVYMSLWFL